MLEPAEVRRCGSGGHQYSVDWLHLAFVTLIAAATLWYLLDARSVSLSVNNLLLVQPLAIFLLLMYLLIVPQCFRRADAAEEPVRKAAEDPLAPLCPPNGGSSGASACSG